MAIKIKCPVCSNTRLLDMVRGRDAVFEIKCPRCASIINLAVKNNRVTTKKV